MTNRCSLLPVCVLLGAALAPSQTVVTHAQWQTPIKNQGNRNTCIAFSAIAALEARYQRQGTPVDLSEDFTIRMDKLNWLHGVWSDIPTADTTENQLVGLGGGSGVGMLHQLDNWLRVPVESALPYDPDPIVLPYEWNHSHWDSQRNVNTWNLDPANLPRSALRQSSYYSIASHVWMPSAQSRSPAAIEAVLQAGYEVVWDFYVHKFSTPSGTSSSIWHASYFNNTGGVHSALIVGYDRSSSNPADHHFIVKNSWGPTAGPGGYTRIGYDYLTWQGITAGYITAVNQPAPWPQLEFLGRRNLRFDGWSGTLDIYHLPLTMTAGFQQFHGITMTDRRVGTFYDSAGVAHRVNGYFVGEELWCWWKGSNKNMRWDEQMDSPTVGRKFRLRVADGDHLAGFHWDNAGTTPTTAYGDYARMPTTMNGTDGFLQPVFPAQPAGSNQWLGRWRVACLGYTNLLVVEARDDSVVPLAQQGTRAGYRCWMTHNGSWIPCTATTDLATWRTFWLAFPTQIANATLQAYMLTWQRGVAAGLIDPYSGSEGGGYLWRLGNYEVGSVTSLGVGCGPAGGVPVHALYGYPEVGHALTYRIENGLPGVPVALIFGTTWQPVFLTQYGAPGCWLRPDPMVLVSGTTGSNGTFYYSTAFHNPSLRGVHLFSQAAVMRPGYNALEFVFSNALDVELGGAF